MRGITSVHAGDNISTCGGITSVLWRVFSILGDKSVHAGHNISTVGDNISTVEGIQYSGATFSTLGDNISTVEVAQYSGDKDLKYYEFSKNLEIFSRAYFASKLDRPHHRTQLLTTADMVKDLGYKKLLLGKILL